MVWESIRRWMGQSPGATRRDKEQQRALLNWAREDGHAFKSVMGQALGAVVETTADWRVEWGPTQRPYYPAQELRFRFDSGLPPDIQILWVTRSLAHSLETDVYQRFTDALQTQVDNSLPDEMRWLAMHGTVSLPRFPALARRFLLISNAPGIAERWIDDEFGQQLEEASATWWSDTQIALMTVNRGMLTLRLPGEGMDATVLRQVGRLFDSAARKLVAAMG